MSNRLLLILFRIKLKKSPFLGITGQSDFQRERRSISGTHPQYSHQRKLAGMRFPVAGGGVACVIREFPHASCPPFSSCAPLRRLSRRLARKRSRRAWASGLPAAPLPLGVRSAPTFCSEARSLRDFAFGGLGGSALSRFSAFCFLRLLQAALFLGLHWGHDMEPTYNHRYGFRKSQGISSSGI